MSNSANPPVVWAQRKDQLFIKIDLPDVKDPKIDLGEDKLTFSGESHGKAYHLDLPFFQSVDKEKSKYVVRPREIEFVIAKKESGPYWDRLTKEGGKKAWLKVDWNKWKDEDEADDAFNQEGMGGFDMSSLGGMGGMPGMEGMDFGDGDSDDDGLESEEKEEEKEEEKK